MKLKTSKSDLLDLGWGIFLYVHLIGDHSTAGKLLLASASSWLTNSAGLHGGHLL